MIELTQEMIDLWGEVLESISIDIKEVRTKLEKELDEVKTKGVSKYES